MYFSIDRFETGGRAVLIGEDKKPLEVPVGMLPQNSREGDVLRYEKGRFVPDPAKTDEWRARMADMLQKRLHGEVDE